MTRVEVERQARPPGHAELLCQFRELGFVFYYKSRQLTILVCPRLRLSDTKVRKFPGKLRQNGHQSIKCIRFPSLGCE